MIHVFCFFGSEKFPEFYFLSLYGPKNEIPEVFITKKAIYIYIYIYIWIIFEIGRLK